MNRSYRIIPVYTGDVSGVASALYELGGMVVMHDPSGCNSTYNTHDETRWYDQDSLIFISGLSQMDAVMGNDEKFIADIEEAAIELKPKFIALCSCPIPYMNGTDFNAIARVLEQDLGIPAFFVKSNGMHDYVQGAGNALAEIAQRFTSNVIAPGHETLSINLLGLTPLDYAASNASADLRAIFEERGIRVISCFAMGDTLDEIAEAGIADVNLVVSAVGLKAAKVLQEKFGTPYIIGSPCEGFTDELIAALRDPKEPMQALRVREDAEAGSKGICIAGEPVTAGSLAAAITIRYGVSVQVLCPLEASEELLLDGDRMTDGEEEMETALSNADIVIADPLYRPILPEQAEFYPLPHEAFSGRCFRRDMKNLYELNI